MNKTTQERPDDDFFFLTFVAEYVEVTTKLLATQEEHHVTMPLTIRGYLLEHDENFYYIGGDPENIHYAVRKDEVVLFTIINPDAEADQILNDFEPQSETDIN